MIQLIARLQPWLILVLGGLVTLASLFLAAGLAHLGYAVFTDAWGWVILFHIITTGMAWLYIPQPFMRAYMLRTFEDLHGEEK